MTTWRLSDIQNISKQAGVYQIKNALKWSYTYKTIESYKKDNAKRTKIIRIYKNGMEKVYSSIAEAAKDTGNIDNRSAISDCLRGKRKTAYGSKWRYYK